MKTLSMTKEQFRAEGERIEAEFKSIEKDWRRSGKAGGIKKYFRDTDGVIRTRLVNVWRMPPKRAKPKKIRKFPPALPQYADTEDVGRSADDMNLQIEHLQYRYQKCRNIETGHILTGEDRKEWERTKQARQDWIPEKRRKRGGHIQTNTITALTEIFAIVSELDDEGIEVFQKFVPTYKEGCETFYPEGGRKLTEV